MKLSEFDFDLPKELIAQFPKKERDHSKLLIPSTNGNNIVNFYEIVDYLQKGDLLIFNDSRVINAQLLIYRDTKITDQLSNTKGKKPININLNKPSGKNTWLGFAKPYKKLEEGDQFIFGNHKLSIKRKLGMGEIEIEFNLDGIELPDFLDNHGFVPLPQYIKRDKSSSEDANRYQTVYSKKKGSVAAATAGLHFTEELLEKIKEKGAQICFVTLHVGAGTFLPVKTENVNEHKMHSEFCEVSENTALLINQTKKSGGRVIAVGTTAMRTLESCSKDGIIYPQTIDTDIFITPGYKFQIADFMITNFHLPKSTLFMLVCAFSGSEKMQSIYKHAIENKMRFFSYGDAMIIQNKESKFSPIEKK